MNNDPSNLGNPSIPVTPFEPLFPSYTNFMDRHPRFGLVAAGVGIALVAACGSSGTSESQESASISSSYTPEAAPTETAPSAETSLFPAHAAVATVFNLGEVPTADNAYISNTETTWDNDPVERFGGIDDPEDRTADGLPTSFTPNHNPFYFALPADEFDETGLIASARESSPWANEQIGDKESLFKGRWIKVARDDKTIYAQWIDCGPSDNPDGARDYQYVFGPSDAKPQNQFGLKAGLDLSPAAAYHLGFGVAEGGAEVTWQFVNDTDVPEGLWKQFEPIDNEPHWN